MRLRFQVQVTRDEEKPAGPMQPSTRVAEAEGAAVKGAGKALSLEHSRPPSTHLSNGVLSRDWEDWALHDN